MKKQADPNQPIGPLFTVDGGGQVRQWSDGWHCTCGGKSGAECSHIKQVWQELERVKKETGGDKAE